MPDMQPDETQKLEQPLFAEVEASKPSPCSYNECLAGHRWLPQVVAANCPGCGSPLIAVQKSQCPYCNEPCVKTILRSDFVPRGSGAARRCTGQVVNGESLDLELTRNQWAEVQDSDKRLFEERRADERSV